MCQSDLRGAGADPVTAFGPDAVTYTDDCTIGLSAPLGPLHGGRVGTVGVRDGRPGSVAHSMQILFTVSGDGPERDVWADADPSVPFGLLAGQLEAGSGGGPERTWWDGDRPLRVDAAVGEEVLDGASLSTSPPPTTPPASTGPSIALRAVGGPHAGTVWHLAAGRHPIGRSDQAAVNLVDDLEVSRSHAVLTVTSGRVTIADDGSAHGVVVERDVRSGQGPDGSGGDPVGADGSDVAEGCYIQVGSTVLAWQAGEPPPSTVVRNGTGGLVFNRPPRLLPPAGSPVVRFPGPPPVQGGVNLPLIAMIAPVVLGVVLALAFMQVLLLLFTLLSPVIGLSNYVSQRRSGGRSHRQRLRVHRVAQAQAEQQLQDALAAETARRRAAAPDPATLALLADGPQTALWERRPADDDFMSLRVGLSDQPAQVAVEGRVESPETAAPVVHRVPALVDLRRDGVLGVAGDRRAAESLATGLLIQAAVLHAPEDLSVTILTGANQRDAWAWARWLPHARHREGRCVARIGSTEASVARLAAGLSGVIDDALARRTGPAATGPEERGGHLVIVDGSYQLGALPVVTKILRHGPEAGVMSICIDDAERLLPEECRAVAVFDAHRPVQLRLSTGRGRHVTDVLADLVDAGTAEEVARRMTPLRLNRRMVAGAAVPTSLRLLDQLGGDPPTGSWVAAGWDTTPRSTRAVVGMSETGPMVVDLARDGPHGLVAGTTGSGKSELLQTLIAGLAVANRPDQMTFVLVDYKGGSAFKECSRLPHTVGMVTDLDHHQTERALASIGAELRRREVLLAGARAKDLEAYWRAARPDDPALGRLVIVIDEFASLVEELSPASSTAWSTWPAGGGRSVST